MTKSIVGLIAVLFLAGCATSMEQQRILACDTWNQTLKEFAIQRASGNITPEQIKTVDALIPVASAACQKTVVNPGGSLAEVQAAIDKLRFERAKR